MRPEGIEPRRKGLRERNSPFCTLSQNGYGDSAAKPSGLRRAWAAERGRSQRQACTPSGDSSGGCVCLGEPRVQRAFVEPARPARPATPLLASRRGNGLVYVLGPACTARGPARPRCASPPSPACQPSPAQPAPSSSPAQLVSLAQPSWASPASPA